VIFGTGLGSPARSSPKALSSASSAKYHAGSASGANTGPFARSARPLGIAVIGSLPAPRTIRSGRAPSSTRRSSSSLKDAALTLLAHALPGVGSHPIGRFGPEAATLRHTIESRPSPPARDPPCCSQSVVVSLGASLSLLIPHGAPDRAQQRIEFLVEAFEAFDRSTSTRPCRLAHRVSEPRGTQGTTTGCCAIRSRVTRPRPASKLGAASRSSLQFSCTRTRASMTRPVCFAQARGTTPREQSTTGD